MHSYNDLWAIIFAYNCNEHRASDREKMSFSRASWKIDTEKLLRAGQFIDDAFRQ